MATAGNGLFEDAVIALLFAVSPTSADLGDLVAKRLMARLRPCPSGVAIDAQGSSGVEGSSGVAKRKPTAEMVEAGYQVFEESCVSDYPCEGDKDLIEEIYLAMVSARTTD